MNNLNYLEHIDFALRSILKKREVEKFIFENALNGLYHFMNNLSVEDKTIINNNFHTIEGVKNILKIYNEGGSCIYEIVEENLKDFSNLVDKLRKL